MQPTQSIDKTTEFTRKHLANIRNSRKSTGPRTEAGKNRVAANAVKGRLTGQKLWLEADEFPDYFAQGMELIEDFRPVGAYEARLVQKIIDHNWRINRCSMLGHNMHVTGLQIHNRDGNDTFVLRLEGLANLQRLPGRARRIRTPPHDRQRRSGKQSVFIRVNPRQIPTSSELALFCQNAFAPSETGVQCPPKNVTHPETRSTHAASSEPPRQTTLTHRGNL